MPATQRGLVAMLRIFGIVSLGGADKPLRISLWRWPSTCKSRVSTSAEQRAALARSIRRLMNSRSFITYSWNQNGWLVLAAISSIEQMLMVDKVNGTPNFSAALAARISPSACCMPVSPVGASATGMLTDHGAGQGTILQIDGNPLAEFDLGEIFGIGAVGRLGPRTGISVIVKHAR